MNYATEVSIYGMLPAYASFIPGNRMVMQKNKKGNKFISFDSSFLNNGDVQVSYMYINEKPDPEKFSSISVKKQLINGPFNEEFFKYRGEKGRHFREYKNKFNKFISISDECSTEKVLDLILRWENHHGKHKYRMMMHSSYDKRFFKSSLELLKDKVKVLYFLDGEKCIGYKVIEREPSLRDDRLLEFRSMLRKYDPSYSHLCLYIDLMSYETIWKSLHLSFCVNVGCSSGGVASYKREKFPVLEDDQEVYFYKNKTNKEK